MSEPIRVLSLGAGVQSTTLLLMMIKKELPMADQVIFADTGWEPQAVYKHLGWLQKVMEENSIDFHIVSKGNIRSDFLSAEKGTHYASMPLHLIGQDGKHGMVRRQCTSEYKLAPLMKIQRQFAGLKSGERCKDHRITTVIGISYDESQRMKDPQFSWIRHDYPLVDNKITRQDCIEWCEANGYPRPPRSACIGCPFKSQEEWRNLYQTQDEWNDAVDFDRSLRELPNLRDRFRGQAYLHKSKVPLAEADIRTDRERGAIELFDDFNQECTGMCGN